MSFELVLIAEGLLTATIASGVHEEAMVSVPALKAAVPPRYKQFARRAFLRVSAVVNAGSGVECPTCRRGFRRFARFRGMHDQCPGCGTLMRQRAVTLLLRDHLRVPEKTGGRVLHVGPARGLSEWISSRPGVDYLSVDLDSPNAMMQADVTDLPFSEGSFDVVLCKHVLEHVPDDKAALAEMFRVLRPGGRAVFQVPPSSLAETFEDASIIDPTERERLFGQYDHVRICGADYGARIADAGFEVDEVDYVARLDQEDRTRYGLRTGEPFFVCRKPPTGS
jgi:SAM-dependent methyltransferase